MNGKEKKRLRNWMLMSSWLFSFYTISSHAAICTYTINNEWNNGFSATISITNDTTSTINDWSVSWSYTGNNRFGSGWNATITGNNPYTAVPLDWNKKIEPGQKAEIGLQGSKSSGAAEVPEITGDICSSNLPPVAIATSNVSQGDAPLTVNFDASASNDPDNGPNALTYQWSFGDGSVSTAVSPSHTFTTNNTYPVKLTVSDGQASATKSLTIVVGDQPITVDNPFRDVKYYVNPEWSAKAMAEPGGAAIAKYNTAVWMDRIGAITDGLGLRGHLDEALNQGVGMFMFVIYNLPNRDCAALASSGELRISENGFNRYKEEYISPIVNIISDPKYAQLRIVAIVEVDSLPNLVTNLDVADCAEANGPGGYRDGIKYALDQLSPLKNVYPYLDIAHSGWLGWSSNFGPAITLISDVIKSTNAGWDSIAGFVTNTANYTPTVEPFLPDPNLSISGTPIRSANFYGYNDYFEEKSYAQDWRAAMIAKGAPQTIGMLIDTGRNGWGGPNRPTKVSTSTNVDTYVNESRVDKRLHRGNWCNQPAGVGFKPWADPYTGIDAFVWVKPAGESDGISDPDFEPDPNDPAKKHDPMCDPKANNRYDPSVKTGALAKAPHAGRWFPEAFAVLVQNAYPLASDPAGPPPPPLPPRSDCPGLDPKKPVLVNTAGVRVKLDLGCKAPIYVKFNEKVPKSLYIENTGDPFDVTVEHTSGSVNATGHFTDTRISGVDNVKVSRNDKATSIEIRYD